MAGSGFAARHWYRRTWVSIALLPLSWLFGTLVLIRCALFNAGLMRRTRVPVPVVVVGNLTAGGTGKTPLVLRLCAELISRGFRPGIVSRGWPGSDAGPRAVSASDDSARVGDEALLMAARSFAPVWIGRDRVAACLALLVAHPEVDVLLCDDGLQHYWLLPDVEIEVIDARGYGNGFLLPAGPLREPVPRPVDLRVLNRGSASGSDPAANDAAIMRIEAGDWFRVCGTDEPVVIQEVLGAASGGIHAVAGIGNPRRFFDTLRELGVAAQEHPFPDHHRFTPADLAFPGAAVVLMTEKDAVKCRKFDDSRLYYLRVDASLPAQLIDALCAKIGQPRGSTTA